jgi:DNA-binding MarR family transcriptional regulator
VAKRKWLTEREQKAWRGLLVMQMQLDGRLRRSLQDHANLSDADYAVLVNLSEAPGDRLRSFELGATLAWEKSRLSHQLRRMQQRGLVTREECPTDRRGAFAVLTKAGRAAVESAAPQHAADVRHWFLDAVTREQLDALTEISGAVLAHLAADDE